MTTTAEPTQVGFATTPAGVTTTDAAEDTPNQPDPDPDTGKLFDVPRVGILTDTTDPTVIKLAFSGSIDLDRTNDADFYNKLAAGDTITLQIDAHVAATKTTHRRDSEGNVDAVVQTKSLTVHSIDS